MSEHVRDERGYCQADGKYIGPPPDDPWWRKEDANGHPLTGSAQANWMLMMTWADGDWASHVCPVERARRVAIYGPMLAVPR